VRALVLCLALAACVSTPQTEDFSWLEGCWRDAESTTLVWSRLEAEEGWVGNLSGLACGEEVVRRRPCRFSIRRIEGVWSIRDETWEYGQTFRLLAVDHNLATFEGRASPHHGPGVLSIEVNANRQTLSISGPITLVFLAGAEPC